MNPSESKKVKLHLRCTTCWDTRGGRAVKNQGTKKECMSAYDKVGNTLYYRCHLNDGHHWTYNADNLNAADRLEELERFFQDNIPTRVSELEGQNEVRKAQVESLSQEQAAQAELWRELQSIIAEQNSPLAAMQQTLDQMRAELAAHAAEIERLKGGKRRAG